LLSAPGERLYYKSSLSFSGLGKSIGLLPFLQTHKS